MSIARDRPQTAFILRHSLTLGVVWSLLILSAAIWSLYGERTTTQEIAAAQARAYFKKDVALRLWATRHGRIYVPVGENYSPDPLLAHVPDRDIETPSGIGLSLINPARIIRELDEQFGHYYGVTGRVISLNPLVARNAPDEWERAALARFAAGKKEVFETADIGGVPYLRLIQPLAMETDCLLCHGHQGVAAGGIAGAVGIALPLAELLKHEANENRDRNFLFGAIWLLGLTGIGLGHQRLAREQRARSDATQALSGSEERNAAILRTALDCIITIDTEGHVVEFNPAAEHTFGYVRAQVIGRPMADLVIPERLRDAHRQGFARLLAGGTSSILGSRIETTGLRSDGSEFEVELTITRVELGDTTLFTAYLRDITEKRLLHEQLNYRATHDSITGLVNRERFEQHLTGLLARSGGRHCLLYLDLDHFKRVIDLGGHAAGDELLRQFAGQVQALLDRDHLFARLGGDEFGVLLNDCTLETAEALATRLIEMVKARRFHWGERIFHLGVAVGIVPFGQVPMPVAELLALADATCFRAKQEGRDRFHAYSLDDTELLRRREELDWVGKIESALQEGRFKLYRQDIHPLNDARDGIRCEILLRMYRHDGSTVTPERFLPAAERYGLMPAIDRWVVGEILRWLERQSGQNVEIALCTVNLSAISIGDPVFLEFVQTALDAARIDRTRLCFEITETAAVANLSRARQFMEQLRRRGVRFALDDFGSGMSSYGYLRELPVDFLKIDGRFVRDMRSDPISLAMVRSIHELGHIMGKYTIAEFVEDDETRAQLAEIGVDYAQGYLFHKPAPIG